MADIEQVEVDWFNVRFGDSEFAYLQQIAIDRKVDITDMLQTIITSGLAMFIGFGLLEFTPDEDHP